jgi:hypothetical protein
MRPIGLLVAALVTACGPGPAGLPEGREAPAAESDTIPLGPGDDLPDPPASPPPAPSLPGLVPLTAEQLRAELGAGPYCTLTDGGGPLMVAKVGGAIVNDGGTIVHLRPEPRDWDALGEGGRFVSDRVTIEVDAGAVIRPVERDASVRVLRGRYGFAVSHGPRWTCGS